MVHDVWHVAHGGGAMVMMDRRTLPRRVPLTSSATPATNVVCDASIRTPYCEPPGSKLLPSLFTLLISCPLSGHSRPCFTLPELQANHLMPAMGGGDQGFMRGVKATPSSIAESDRAGFTGPKHQRGAETERWHSRAKHAQCYRDAHARWVRKVQDKAMRSAAKSAHEACPATMRDAVCNGVTVGMVVVRW